MDHFQESVHCMTRKNKIWRRNSSKWESSSSSSFSIGTKKIKAYRTAGDKCPKELSNNIRILTQLVNQNCCLCLFYMLIAKLGLDSRHEMMATSVGENVTWKLLRSIRPSIPKNKQSKNEITEQFIVFGLGLSLQSTSRIDTAKLIPHFFFLFFFYRTQPGSLVADLDHNFLFARFIMHVLNLTAQQPFGILGHSTDRLCLTYSTHPDTPTDYHKQQKETIGVKNVWEVNRTRVRKQSKWKRGWWTHHIDGCSNNGGWQHALHDECKHIDPRLHDFMWGIQTQLS